MNLMVFQLNSLNFVKLFKEFTEFNEFNGFPIFIKFEFNWNLMNLMRNLN